VRYVRSFEPLDENKWLRFEEKPIDNFFRIAGDLDPNNAVQYNVLVDFGESASV
jgi:hypothetical protein